jgi:hypothetical protein
MAVARAHCRHKDFMAYMKEHPEVLAPFVKPGGVDEDDEPLAVPKGRPGVGGVLTRRQAS